MIVPDINLLLYTYNSTFPFFEKAKAWWEECLSGPETVGLPRVVIYGFIRIATNPRAFPNPMKATEAAGHVRSWMARPQVRVLDSGPQHVSQALEMLENLGTAGNLVTDAQIAVMALSHEAVLHTSDADFVRFPGLHWFNPLTGIGSSSLKKFRL